MIRIFSKKETSEQPPRLVSKVIFQALSVSCLLLKKKTKKTPVSIYKMYTKNAKEKTQHKHSTTPKEITNNKRLTRSHAQSVRSKGKGPR